MQSERYIELHGWDSRNQAWSGPDELSYSLKGGRRILDGLREGGGCWHGELRVKAPQVPPLTFYAQVYDLGDGCVATLDMEGSPGGPLEVVLVIPAERRSMVRPEMAFEFAAYLRFLEGPVSRGSEMAIFDRVERTLRETDARTTIVFSMETRFAGPEVHILTAQACERLAMAMVAWAGEKHAAGGKA